MKLSIKEQKKFLSHRLKTEALRENDGNKEDIKSFVQATKGGCKYIYLFAADNTEPLQENTAVPPMWTPDYDPYEEVKIDSDSKEELHMFVKKVSHIWLAFFI